MKQCERGHIYDEKAYASCPYCGQSSAAVRPLGDVSAPSFPQTAPADGLSAPSFPATAPIDTSAAPGFPPTMPVNAPSPAPARPKKEMSATVALNTGDDGEVLACGWLVVTSDKKKGKSFVIHSEKNTLGRGSGFDVNLSFDESISKNGDAVITYDNRGKKFFITLAAGKNNIYHNGNLLLTPEEIKDYDVIEVGSTKLVFRSFCNEEFDY